MKTLLLHLSWAGPALIVAVTVLLRLARGFIQKKAAQTPTPAPKTALAQSQGPPPAPPEATVALIKAMQQATEAADAGKAPVRTRVQVDLGGEAQADVLPFPESKLEAPLPGKRDAAADVSVTDARLLPPEHGDAAYLVRQGGILSKDGQPRGKGVMAFPMDSAEVAQRIGAYEAHRVGVEARAQAAYQEALIEIVAKARDIAERALPKHREAHQREADQRKIALAEVEAEFVATVIAEAEKRARVAYEGYDLEDPSGDKYPMLHELTPERIKTGKLFQH